MTGLYEMNLRSNADAATSQVSLSDVYMIAVSVGTSTVAHRPVPSRSDAL